MVKCFALFHILLLNHLNLTWLVLMVLCETLFLPWGTETSLFPCWTVRKIMNDSCNVGVDPADQHIPIFWEIAPEIRKQSAVDMYSDLPQGRACKLGSVGCKLHVFHVTCSNWHRISAHVCTGLIPCLAKRTWNDALLPSWQKRDKGGRIIWTHLYKLVSITTPWGPWPRSKNCLRNCSNDWSEKLWDIHDITVILLVGHICRIDWRRKGWA